MIDQTRCANYHINIRTSGWKSTPQMARSSMVHMCTVAAVTSANSQSWIVHYNALRARENLAGSSQFSMVIRLKALVFQTESQFLRPTVLAIVLTANRF